MHTLNLLIRSLKCFSLTLVSFRRPIFELQKFELAVLIMEYKLALTTLANVVCNASQVFPDAFYSRNIHLRDSTGESISRTGGCYMCDRCHGTLYADWALLLYCLFFGRGKIALTSGRYCCFSCPEYPLSVEGFNSVYTYWDIQSRMIHTEICLMLSLLRFSYFIEVVPMLPEVPETTVSRVYDHT